MRARSGMDDDFDEWSHATGLRCDDESRTVQSDLMDSDINVIVERFGITGQLPNNVRPPTFVDFTEVFDFRSALEQIEMAQDAFMSMPAKVRARFENDPQKFVEFCSDMSNLDEMRKLGLAEPAKEVKDALQETKVSDKKDAAK